MIDRRTYWTGTALLALALVAALLLVNGHFGRQLPGCGPRSACQSLESTAWGRVPGTAWPVSFVGLAYFAALVSGWLAGGRSLARGGAWLVRSGAAFSVLFVVVMLALRKLCPYCLAVHASNLLFAALVERARRGPGQPAPRSAPGRPTRVASPRRGAAAFASVFIAVSLVLGLAGARHARAAGARAEADRRASSERIAARAATAPAGAPADPWGPGGFTGRYRLGPETAPLRIVILTDYQCPDCRRVELELEEILATRTDVSLSMKHFPMCKEAAPGVPCNRAAPSNLHPNACWAARAAEAAGILKGDAGFWAMHRWLFQRGGAFTSGELDAGLRQLGYDPAVFTGVMSSEETLKRVRADVEEGVSLGLFYTPMIFVNGVEFRGWQTAGALKRTLIEVAAKNPPARTAADDRPPLAPEKYVADWREQPAHRMPADTGAWSLGATGAAGAIDVVLFGDYREPFTASMDAAIRAFMRGRSGIRYTFRHFPVDPECNTALPKNLRPEAVHPGACRAAKAAEAAGSLGGAKAWWAAHEWLMAHQDAAPADIPRLVAAAAGVSEPALAAAMETPAVSAAILEDARAASELGLSGIPMVFVNGKWVPRTTRDGDNVVVRILGELGPRPPR